MNGTRDNSKLSNIDSSRSREQAEPMLEVKTAQSQKFIHPLLLKRDQLHEEIKLSYLQRTNGGMRDHISELKTEIANLEEIWMTRETEYSAIIRASKLYQKNDNPTIPFDRELNNFVRSAERYALATREALRREQEINSQMKHQYSTTISQQQTTISELGEKLNALQACEGALYDEQCITEWRKLQRSLEVWVAKSFKNSAVLNTMTANSLLNKGIHRLHTVPPKEILEKSMHTRRKYIQSLIARLTFDEVFRPLFVQTPSRDMGYALHEMGNMLKNKVDRHIWEHWRSSTSVGLQLLNSYDRVNDACKLIIDTVDSFFGEYYDQEVSLMHDKLVKFFSECACFKRKLERGKFDYQFQCSQTGASYLKEYMKSVNAEDDDGAIVQMSVWPAILKASTDKDSLVLEQEAVWTSVPENRNNSNLLEDEEMEEDSSKGEIESAEDMSVLVEAGC